MHFAVALAQVNTELRYSQEEADAYFPANHPLTLSFTEPVQNPNGYIDSHFYSMSMEERLRVVKVIINIPDRTSWNFMLEGFPNLKEVWFGPDTYPDYTLTAFANNGSNYPELAASNAALSRECSVFLPSGKYPKGLLSIREIQKNNVLWKKRIPVQLFKFNTLLYDGDLDSAVERGASSCKSYCPGHDFKAKVLAAHTVANYTDCQQPIRFYYSCKHCGECEYNINHTFTTYDPSATTGVHAHAYETCDLSEKNFIGYNFKGEKVYALSCIWCGLNECEVNEKVTQADMDLLFGKGNMPVEYYKEQYRKAWYGSYKEKALQEVTTETLIHARYFAVPEDDHGAKTSSEALNETRWAMVYGLVDKDLLGVDYLQNINREQMASLAVRLAEYLTGKKIKAASASKYSDTRSAYALKAYTADIMRFENKTFAPDAVVTREEMATCLFRALQYVIENSDIRYTVYTPDLDAFKDRGEISDWALEAMGFMHTLGLVKSPAKNTLDPLAECTIEEAVSVAQRCVHADEIGWYQGIRPTEKGYAGSEGGWGIKRFNDYPSSGSFLYDPAYLSYDNGDRIWVHDNWVVRGYACRGQRTAILPFIDPHSGCVLYASGQDFLPIKDNCDDKPKDVLQTQNNAPQTKTEKKNSSGKQESGDSTDELAALVGNNPEAMAAIQSALQMAGGEMSAQEREALNNMLSAMGSNPENATKQPERQNAEHQQSDVYDMVMYGTLNGHEWVDMGFPSGTKWATCNLGAKEPQNIGGHFACGETTTKSNYTQSNAKTYDKQLSEYSGNPAYDAATVQWGKGWRVPTRKEFEELLEYCYIYYMEYEGRIGMMFTSEINQQSIFLPCAGSMIGTEHHSPKMNGVYMTSTPYEDYLNKVWGWLFSSETDYMGNLSRSEGCSIRPVTD